MLHCDEARSPWGCHEMAYVLVNATDNGAKRTLSMWFGQSEGHASRTYLKKHLMRKLGPTTYLLHANGKILAVLYDLKRKYPRDIYLFVVEPLEELYIPEDIKSVVNECRKRGRLLKEEDLNKLERIRLDCSVSSRLSSSP